MAITIAFIGFVVFNLIGLVSSYIALETVVSELKKYPEIPEITHGTITAMIKRFHMGFWQLGIIFHLVIDVIVVYFISFLSGRSVSK